MASGYRAFVAATVLDAADLTDYCSSQAVMRFANAAARDAALTVSIVTEGMVAYLIDTNVLQVNTDSTTSGWKQYYPAITASITDGNITNAKMASASVSSSNIIDATIVGGDIAAATITGSNIATGTITSGNILDATITGSDIASGTITSANILDGTIAPGDLAAGTFTISISGNAATASDSSLLDGYDSNANATANTIVLRDAGGGMFGTEFKSTTATAGFDFYSTGTHTGIGANNARVVNSGTVYSQLVTSARTVLINSAGTLGTSVSSRRYKDDIQILTTDADTILQLNPVTFFYKPELYEEGQERVLEVGVIAEQAADLGLEQLVSRNAAGEPDAIFYEKLSVYLLKVCQSQQTQLDALSARLDAIGA